MRLKSYQIKAIKETFFEVFESGEIYLFGSRVRDNLRGGDIDLYLVVKDKKDLFKKKIKFLAKLKRKIGEQKIDIEKEARKWGVKI